MGWLFTDQPNTIVEGLALAATALAIALGFRARARARATSNSVGRLYWRDLSHVAWSWAAAAGLTLAGARLAVEGLQMPIWLVVELGVAAAVAIIVRRRWREQGMARSDRDLLTPVGTPVRRLTSTAWAIGLLGAGAGFLAFYMVTVSHLFAHPVHWGLSGLGGALGYAVGLAIATPRYSVGGPRTQ